MRNQAVQKVVRILPDRFGHDQTRGGVDLAKDLHPFPLRTDEPMLFLPLVGVSPDQLVAKTGHRIGQRLLHLVLRRPAVLVGRQAEVPVGDQENLFLTSLLELGRFGKCVGWHQEVSLKVPVK